MRGTVDEWPSTTTATRATRRDLLLAGAAVAPCACAVCLAQTQTGKDLYKRFFARALATMMDGYEERVAPKKSALLGSNLAALAAPSAGGPSPRRLAVLDLGVGAAPNAPILAAVPGMGRVTGVDPNPFMFSYARAKAADAGFLVACGEEAAAPDDGRSSSDPRPTFTTVRAAAEALPFPDASFDAVVCTLVLCSVSSVPDALAEAARVLRPGGRFLFHEHTAADWEAAPWTRAAQAAFNPLQQALADGCHLTRDPEASVRAAPGLRLVEADRFTVPGLAFIGPHVEGVAVRE